MVQAVVIIILIEHIPFFLFSRRNIYLLKLYIVFLCDFIRFVYYTINFSVLFCCYKEGRMGDDWEWFRGVFFP